MPFHHTTRRIHDTAEASHVTSPFQTGPDVSSVVDRLALNLCSIWQRPSRTTRTAFGIQPGAMQQGNRSADQQYKAAHDGIGTVMVSRDPDISHSVHGVLYPLLHAASCRPDQGVICLGARTCFNYSSGSSNISQLSLIHI